MGKNTCYQAQGNKIKCDGCSFSYHTYFKQLYSCFFKDINILKQKQVKIVLINQKLYKGW